MLIEKPAFHRRTADTIAQLAREGITVTPEEICWLNHAAGKCIRPTAVDELLFLDLPYPCGNVLLWPLSIGARIWLEKCGRTWFKGAGDLEELVMAYAMAHSRKPAVLQNLISQTKARFQVAKWAAGLNATMAEINEAIAHAMSPDDVDLVDLQLPNAPRSTLHAPRASDYGDVIALLCHFIKDDPDYWMWHASEEYAAAMIKKISTALPGDRHIDDDHAKFVAISQYNLVVTEIRSQRSEVRGQKSEIKHTSDQKL